MAVSPRRSRPGRPTVRTPAFIGGRFNFVVWDDLVDPKKQKTVEAKEGLQDYWDDVSEPRLEPAGLLILQGQRLASDDLYRYCLDKTVGEEIDYDTGEMIGPQAQVPPHPVQGPLRGEVQPRGTHRPDGPNYPEGCLLSNWRLPVAGGQLPDDQPGRAVRGGLPAAGLGPRLRPGPPGVDPRPRRGSGLCRRRTGTDSNFPPSPMARQPSPGTWSR